MLVEIPDRAKAMVSLKNRTPITTIAQMLMNAPSVVAFVQVRERGRDREIYRDKKVRMSKNGENNKPPRQGYAHDYSPR
jgi:hypothetical protein